MKRVRIHPVPEALQKAVHTCDHLVARQEECDILVGAETWPHTKAAWMALSLLIDKNERKQPKSSILVTDLMFPYIYIWMLHRFFAAIKVCAMCECLMSQGTNHIPSLKESHQNKGILITVHCVLIMICVCKHRWKIGNIKMWSVSISGKLLDNFSSFVFFCN